MGFISFTSDYKIDTIEEKDDDGDDDDGDDARTDHQSGILTFQPTHPPLCWLALPDLLIIQNIDCLQFGQFDIWMCTFIYFDLSSCIFAFVQLVS